MGFELRPVLLPLQLQNERNVEGLHGRIFCDAEKPKVLFVYRESLKKFSRETSGILDASCILRPPLFM